MLADKKLNAFILKNTAPQILLIVGDMTRPSNFKGGVVAQGGECRKFAFWLKHWCPAKKLTVIA